MSGTALYEYYKDYLFKMMSRADQISVKGAVSFNASKMFLKGLKNNFLAPFREFGGLYKENMAEQKAIKDEQKAKLVSEKEKEVNAKLEVYQKNIDILNSIDTSGFISKYLEARKVSAKKDLIKVVEKPTGILNAPKAFLGAVVNFTSKKYYDFIAEQLNSAINEVEQSSTNTSVIDPKKEVKEPVKSESDKVKEASAARIKKAEEKSKSLINCFRLAQSIDENVSKSKQDAKLAKYVQIQKGILSDVNRAEEIYVNDILLNTRGIKSSNVVKFGAGANANTASIDNSVKVSDDSKTIAELQSTVAKLQSMVATLSSKNKELEEKLNLQSSSIINSEKTDTSSKKTNRSMYDIDTYRDIAVESRNKAAQVLNNSKSNNEKKDNESNRSMYDINAYRDIAIKSGNNAALESMFKGNSEVRANPGKTM